MILKSTLIDIGVGVLRRISKDAVRWFFNPEKWAARREKERLRWARYRLRAQETQDTLDDQISDAIAAGCKFRTMPGGMSLEDRVQHFLGQAMSAWSLGKQDDVYQLIKAANDLLTEHK